MPRHLSDSILSVAVGVFLADRKGRSESVDRVKQIGLPSVDRTHLIKS